jgi:hypothetical protein
MNIADSLDGGSACRKAATYARQQTQKRMHDPSVRKGEDIPWLRPLGHCDRQLDVFLWYVQTER